MSEDPKRCDRADLRPQLDLLIGRLFLAQPTPETRPKLQVSAWCPRCRGCHLHRWPDPPVDRGGAIEVAGRCREGPRDYYVGLDSTQAKHNDHIIRLADAAFAAWDRRQAAREAQCNGH